MLVDRFLDFQVMRLFRIRILPCLLALQCLPGRIALADELPWDLVERSQVGVPALTVSGTTGGLTLPDGRVLPDGTAVFGFNTYHDPRFFRAKRGENYLFALGMFPYLEVSGRLTNYPADPTTGGFGFVSRDLSANAKLAVPKLVDGQPDIAFGINDLGGGAQNFRSTYAVASDAFGALRWTVGVARGRAALGGIFGGLELPLGNSGFSLLAEHNTKINSAGIRYASAPIAVLANAQIVATAQRTFGARAPNGSPFDRSALGLALVIPFGDNARAVSVPPSNPVVQAPPVTSSLPRSDTAVVSLPVPASAMANSTPLAALAPVPAAAPTMHPRPQEAVDSPSLAPLQAALEQAGLERVRVGRQGNRLIIEYENHRYNQNEVDAIGIAFGLGARLAPASVTRLIVITKKAGLGLYETSVDRAGFRAFLEDADPYQVIAGLQSQMRPVEDPTIDWYQRDEGKRGFSRVVVRPLINSFVGTEVGLFDYSLAVSTQAFVPLWKGAEVSTEYVRNVADSDNVRNGPFTFGSQRTGVKSALLSQAWWVTDDVLNVFSIGKLQYDFTGVQNEATWFIGATGDQARLEYSRLDYSDRFVKETRVNAGAFYRWQYQPLDLSLEAGYSQYVGNDRGPSVRVSRWFGDIEAQAYLRRGAGTTFAGFQLVFPLTPRQGMRPGITHVEGASRFGYGLETKLARQGGDNRITRDVAQEIPLAYSARNLLLNRARIGEDYFISQLPRMREAALLFSPLK